MNRVVCCRVLPLLVIIATVSGLRAPAWAAWPSNGVPIAMTVRNEAFPFMTGDGAGGVYVAWLGGSSPTDNVYCQHVNGGGTPQWAANGVGLFQGSSGLVGTGGICSDGAGGAIVTWYDINNNTYEIRAQRVHPDGALAWGANGVLVTPSNQTQAGANVVADGSGGAYVSWNDGRGGSYVPYGQHLSSTGALLWDPNGISLDPAASSFADVVIMAPWAPGGFVRAWQDNRSGNYDIYAQIVNPDGSLDQASSIGLCTTTGDQTDPFLFTDNSRGVFCAWTDGRSPTKRVYINKYDESSHLYWVLNGKQVSTSSTAGDSCVGLVGDGVGGVLIGWRDARNASTAPDVYVQRLNTNGSLYGSGSWVEGGVALDQEPWREAPLGLVSSGSGGAVAVWDDGRDASHYALYARGITSLGASVWPVGGSAVMSSATAGLDADFAAVGDGAGGVFAAYGINNPTTSWDVYLNRIGPGPLTGVIPSLPSGLLSFSAAPNPFNGSLHLVVTTPVGGPLAADLLDVEGRVVARIANETVEAGTISLDWQVPGPRSIKPGVYYARVRVGRVMRFERLVEGG